MTTMTMHPTNGTTRSAQRHAEADARRAANVPTDLDESLTSEQRAALTGLRNAVTHLSRTHAAVVKAITECLAVNVPRTRIAAELGMVPGSMSRLFPLAMWQSGRLQADDQATELPESVTVKDAKGVAVGTFATPLAALDAGVPLRTTYETFSQAVNPKPAKRGRKAARGREAAAKRYLERTTSYVDDGERKTFNPRRVVDDARALRALLTEFIEKMTNGAASTRRTAA